MQAGTFQEADVLQAMFKIDISYVGLVTFFELNGFVLNAVKHNIFAIQKKLANTKRHFYLPSKPTLGTGSGLSLTLSEQSFETLRPFPGRLTVLLQLGLLNPFTNDR